MNTEIIRKTLYAVSDVVNISAALDELDSYNRATLEAVGFTLDVERAVKVITTLVEQGIGFQLWAEGNPTDRVTVFVVPGHLSALKAIIEEVSRE